MYVLRQQDFKQILWVQNSRQLLSPHRSPLYLLADLMLLVVYLKVDETTINSKHTKSSHYFVHDCRRNDFSSKQPYSHLDYSSYGINWRYLELSHPFLAYRTND